MTGLLITLGVLLAIGCIPVGVYAKFEDALTVSLTVLGIRIPLYPAKKKDAAPKKEKPAKEKQKFSLPPKAALEEYLRLLLDLLGDLRRKILLRKLKLHAVFGGHDEADAALNYGKAWAAIGVVMPLLEACFRIRKRDVGAFLSKDEKAIRLYAEACATLTVGQILHLVIHALVRFLKIYKTNKPEKAVQ